MKKNAAFRTGLCALVVAVASRWTFALPVPVQEHYQWYSDDGPEASATSKVPPDQPYRKLVAGEQVRLRFAIANDTEEEDAKNYRLRVEYSVSRTNIFRQVPVSTDLEPFEMALSPHISNGEATTDRLSGRGNYLAGVCVEVPSNRTDALDIPKGTYGNYEYCIRATTNAVGGQTYFFRVSDFGTPFDELNGQYEQIAEALVIGKPVITNRMATGIEAQSAVMNGEVLDARGDDPYVWIYWGDTDGGMNPGSWSNTVELGVKLRTFSHALTGLPANEAIYYRCCASNAAGLAWAGATTRFTTLSPAVAFTNAPYGVNEGATSVTVKVVMDTPSAEDVSVVYATADGSAVSGSDYTAVTGVLSWAAGETGVRDIVVAIADDDADEPGELFHVRLSHPTNCTIDATETSVAINDNDGLPTIQFSATASTGHESVPTASIGLTLEPSSGLDVTVAYTVAADSGTAVAGDDYVFTSGIAVLASGRTESNIFLTVINDTEYEMPETVVVTLSSPSNALLGVTTSHVYTITDTDPRPPTMGNWNGASGISSAGATLRGEVEDTGRDDPDVAIYWGPADGGTSIDAWSNVVHLGVMGQQTFGSNIAVAATGTLFYYRSYGTNTAGAGWAAASENFRAVDPPTFLLLDNESIEQAGAKPDYLAQSWRNVGDDTMQRVNEFPRSGSYSILFPSQAGAYMYGYWMNAFQATWNGRFWEGQVHPNGGVRPGFVMNGVAHARAREYGMDPSLFSFGWRNLDDSSNWMSNQVMVSDTVYQSIPVANTNPIPVVNTGDRFLPAIRRETVGTMHSDIFHVDDISVQVTVPRLDLERNPNQQVAFPTTVAGTSTETMLGARNLGGGPNTVLYGAYLPSSDQLTDKDWDFTAWHEIYDPSNAFQIVSGASLVATNDAGFQHVTLAFAPNSPGTYTGVVRIATTDPNDYYASGGKLYDSIVYERYVLVGKAIRPPLVECKPVGIREGHSGRSTVVFTLMLETQVLVNASVDYETADGTATAGEDYVHVSGKAFIPAGQRMFQVETEVMGDLTKEKDEIFYLMLSNPENATLPDPPYGVCGIRDDESSLIIIR